MAVAVGARRRAGAPKLHGLDRGTSGPRLDHLSAGARGANNFNLLRLVGAGCVLFGHSFDLLHVPQPLRPGGLSWGHVGVLIFFAISGFLVSRSWAADPRLVQFVLKRALRLLPALALALLVSALVLGPLVTSFPIGDYLSSPGTKAYVLNNVTMQTNGSLPGVFLHNVYPAVVNGSLWTLPLEVKAYVLVVIVGLVGLLSRLRWGMPAIAAYAVLASVPAWLVHLPAGVHFVASLVDIQMPHGIQVAVRAGDGAPYADLFAAFTVAATMFALRERIVVRWLWFAPCAGILAIAFAVGGRWPELAAIVLTPYLVLCVAYRTHGLFHLPRRLGDYSYGIYLYAFPVQQTVSQVASPSSGWVELAIAAPVTVLLAIASWHLVEGPALELKSRLGGGSGRAIGVAGV